MIRMIFSDFFTLFNRKIVSPYLWIFLYAFIFTIDNNFFICSYLKIYVFNLDENVMLIFLLSLSYVFFKIFIIGYLFKIKLKKKKRNKNIIKLYIIIRYITYIFYSTSIKHIIEFNVKILNLFNIYIYKFYKSYFINNLIVLTIILFLDNIIIWKPIFKTHSIYGYYKATRLSFADTKCENFKVVKY